MRYGFAINVHRCVGCRTCTVACKMEFRLSEGVQRMRVLNDAGETTYDVPVGTYPDLAFHWRPVPCQHCDQAPCVQVCPVGATYVRDDGIVAVDEASCIGCGACVAACPYGARQMDPETSIVQKCSLCAHRLDAGLETTMCQLTCPNRAITVGDLDDSESEIARLLTTYDAELYEADAGTGPRAYYFDSSPKKAI